MSRLIDADALLDRKQDRYMRLDIEVAPTVEAYTKEDVISMFIEFMHDVEECVDGGEGSPSFERGVAIAQNQVIAMIYDKIKELRGNAE